MKRPSSLTLEKDGIVVEAYESYYKIRADTVNSIFQKSMLPELKCSHEERLKAFKVLGLDNTPEGIAEMEDHTRELLLHNRRVYRYKKKVNELRSQARNELASQIEAWKNLPLSEKEMYCSVCSDIFFADQMIECDEDMYCSGCFDERRHRSYEQETYDRLGYITTDERYKEERKDFYEKHGFYPKLRLETN